MISLLYCSTSINRDGQITFNINVSTQYWFCSLIKQIFITKYSRYFRTIYYLQFIQESWNRKLNMLNRPLSKIFSVSVMKITLYRSCLSTLIIFNTRCSKFSYLEKHYFTIMFVRIVFYAVSAIFKPCYGGEY